MDRTASEAESFSKAKEALKGELDLQKRGLEMALAAGADGDRVKMAKALFDAVEIATRTDDDNVFFLGWATCMVHFMITSGDLGLVIKHISVMVGNSALRGGKN